MNAITLHQPWASLVALGRKTIETRSWRPPWDAIGEPLAIHAALVRPGSESSLSAGQLVRLEQIFGADWRETLPRGKVVCIADLDSIQKIEWNTVVRNSDNRLFGDYTLGRWMWWLKNVRPVDPPQPARGWQSVWKWEPEGE